MFGGRDANRGRKQQKAYYFNGSWHQIQSLVKNRSGHQSVISGEKIMHIGGDGQTKPEIWTFTGKARFEMFEGVTEFEDWGRFPHAFSIDAAEFE